MDEFESCDITAQADSGTTSNRATHLKLEHLHLYRYTFTTHGNIIHLKIFVDGSILLLNI